MKPRPVSTAPDATLPRRRRRSRSHARAFALAATVGLTASLLVWLPAPGGERISPAAAVPAAGELVTSTEVLLAASSTRRCVKVSTPRGPVKVCRNLPPVTRATKFKFCATVKGKKYCRTIVVRPPRDPEPAPTPDPTPTPTPTPTAPTDPYLHAEALPYTPLDRNRPGLQGSESDYLLMGSGTFARPPMLNLCRTVTWAVSAPDEWADLTRKLVADWADAIDIRVEEVPYPADWVPFVSRPDWRSLPQEQGLPFLTISWGSKDNIPYFQTSNAIGAAQKQWDQQTRTVLWAQVAIRTPEGDPDAERGWEGVDRPTLRELTVAVVLHELGHVSGLDHVDVPTRQAMMAAMGNYVPSEYQRGDLAGLDDVYSDRSCRAERPPR